MAVADVNALLAGMVAYPSVFGKDAVTAEAAGTPHTPWYSSGITGAGAAPTGGLNGATFSGTSGLFTGGIPMPAGVTGETVYLARASATHGGNIGQLWIIDRQWGNVPVVTTTGSQAVTSPTWVSRDGTGTTLGVGVLLALEISATTGNAGAITNTTVGYTNSAGTAGRTGTISSVPATTLQGTFIPFTLGAGDIGVRSVQSVVLGTSYVSGALHIVAFRLLATLELPTANIGYRANAFDLGLPAAWNDSVLQMVYWPTTTAPGAVFGSLSYTQV